MQFDQLKRREFVTLLGGARSSRPGIHGPYWAQLRERRSAVGTSTPLTTGFYHTGNCQVPSARHRSEAPLTRDWKSSFGWS
jgi:hypothetical protein